MDIETQINQAEEEIPYDEMDPGIRDLVRVFNEKVKLKTKYSCWGHEENDVPFIIFDESVSEEEIIELASFLINKDFSVSVHNAEMNLGFGTFSKRVYGFEELLIDWMFEFPYAKVMGDFNSTNLIKESFSKRFSEVLELFSIEKFSTRT